MIMRFQQLDIEAKLRQLILSSKYTEQLVFSYYELFEEMAYYFDVHCVRKNNVPILQLGVKVIVRKSYFSTQVGER
jgi:hypothetical protein